MTIQLIGDEIHFDGGLVAILTTNAAPSHLARFTDALEEAGDNGHAVLGKLEKQAGESARGGLLRMSDLAKIITRLKEG